MKSEGFFQTPQDIMEEYNGCSVPQYTAYPSDRRLTRGSTKGSSWVESLAKESRSVRPSVFTETAVGFEHSSLRDCSYALYSISVR